MTFLMFLMALSLSAVAAFYAIFGLVAIFAAAPTPIIIMGTLLEGAKLVVASWLYRNWKEVPILLKSYFMVALAVLMFLTSMGIFGFLSRAHVEQGISTQETAVLIAEIDRQIDLERRKIGDALTVIGQLDQVVQVLSDAQRIRGADGAIAVRERQADERQRYNDLITQANSIISDLQTERLPLVQRQMALETEVGPIKYIAALVYGTDPNAEMLEHAVRWVIILIVAVFDPLAVLMLIAANWSLKQNSYSKEIQPNLNPHVPQSVHEHVVAANETVSEHHTVQIKDSLSTNDSAQPDMSLHEQHTVQMKEEPTTNVSSYTDTPPVSQKQINVDKPPQTKKKDTQSMIPGSVVWRSRPHKKLIEF